MSLPDAAEDGPAGSSSPSPAGVGPVVAEQSRAAWYVHRLRSMSPREVPFRIGEQIHRARGRRASDLRVAEPTTRVGTGLGNLVLSWSDEDGVGDHWSAHAEALTAGNITVFGRRWPTGADGTPDWHLDPTTGYRWPSDYCFDVDVAPAEGAEVKYVWELNRLLYLVPASARAASGDDVDLRARCRRHLSSWIEANPPRRGVTWRSGIECAMRILAFVLVLELTASDRETDPGLESLVGRSVAEHVDWIRRFPSRYSSANNHRVAELAGLLIAAAAYPGVVDGVDADRWREEFDDIVTQQFHADGVPAEQATLYGLLVLEWVGVVLFLDRRAGRTVSSEVRERLTAALRFLVGLTDSAGQAVAIGDGDDSRLLSSARPAGDLASTVCRLVAAGLEEPLPEAPRGLSTYSDGGYTTWREGSGAEETLWVLDHGPLGMGRLAAHAHADTLAVYLHAGGRPLLLDAGTYLYHSAADWRNRFRGTAEHNTVAVGDADSSVMSGPFNWRVDKRAAGRLIDSTASAEGWRIEAEHTGYVQRHGIAHRRRLEGLGARSFRLTDTLVGASGAVRFRWSLLLAPGLEAVPGATGWLVCSDGVTVASLDVSPPWHSSTATEAAWCSRSFGSIEPAVRLVIDGLADPTAPIEVTLELPTPVRPRPATAMHRAEDTHSTVAGTV